MVKNDDIEDRARRRRFSAKAETFESLDLENEAERSRLARMSPAERLAELEALMERRFGPGWKKKPIEKVWSYEIVDWA
ncbi:MAG: hypothetical protein R6V85_19750 [Polyangia bacterium]